MTATRGEAWCRTAERNPDDGQRVLAYFQPDEDGAELWVVLEYHAMPAKRSYSWTWPGNPEAEYSTPTCWQPLVKPDVQSDDPVSKQP